MADVSISTVRSSLLTSFSHPSARAAAEASAATAASASAQGKREMEQGAFNGFIARHPSAFQAKITAPREVAGFLMPPGVTSCFILAGMCAREQSCLLDCFSNTKINHVAYRSALSQNNVFR
jgi:hypothetical protein